MDIIERLCLGVVTTSPNETQSLAATLAASVPPNQVLKLSGSLGTGKTTFVQGLAAGFKITETVKSPTFNLYTIYQGTMQLVHFDAYRLSSLDQAESLLIEEFLKSPFCLIIEWPEKIEEWMTTDAWKFEFSIQGDQQHLIKLESHPG